MSKIAETGKPADLIASIIAYNAGRDPERLAMKYAKMAGSPFVFLRGACHLFYEALPDSPLFRTAPLAWSCGDLHFENFGSYKGDNRQVYFDINDFDEAALAPASWDLVRLLSSLQSGADILNIGGAEAQAVCQCCVEAYREGLINGKPLWVERETSDGLVSRLLTSLQDRSRTSFLDKHTIRKGPQRLLKLDGAKALPATEAQKKLLTDFMGRFAATQSTPKFYQVLDVARRIAGTGSLGLERFVVLVEGKGSPDGNYLLDVKEAKPSALGPHLSRLGIHQPAWKDDAWRVVTVQKRMQAVNHAFLQAVTLEGKAFILKALQPAEDRVAIGEWDRKLDKLKEVAATLGHLLAWDQLRASGRAGSASADALITYAEGDDWVKGSVEAARQMTRTTLEQWHVFGEAYRAGKLGG